MWTGNQLPGGDVVAIAIDPVDAFVLYAGTSAGVFKSTNGGESWTATGFLTPVLSIAVDPLVPDRVYVGGFRTGAFRSSDGGTSWSSVGEALHGHAIAAFAIDPSDSERLYAGSLSGELFRSVDGGVTWQASIPDVPEVSGGSIWSIAIDPSNPRVLYVAAHSVLKSTDSGATWTRSGNFLSRIVAVDPKSPRIVYAGGTRFDDTSTMPGFFRSDDGGESWVIPTAAEGKVDALAIDPVRPNTLYAGASVFFRLTGVIGLGVRVSRDRGTTWQPFNEGDPFMWQRIVRALVIDGTGRRLHAATSSGVFDYEVVPSFPVTLPAAASLHGVPPAFFHSDVAVFNGSAGGTAEVTATYRCFSGVCGNSPRTFSVPPRQLVLFEDFAASLFGAPESSGAIEFSSTEPIVVTSRLYTPARPEPTLGMFVPGLGPERAFSLSHLTNLSHSADPSTGFRTNLGAFNTSDQSRTVFFNCRESSGVYFGTVSRQAAPHQLVQINDHDLFRELGVTRDVPSFYCLAFGDLSIPLHAWASVIDNKSTDSYFVTGQGKAINGRNVTLPAAASLHGAEETFFRSDVAILNQDFGFPAEVTAHYRCFLGVCAPSEKTFTLAPGEMRIFADVIGSLFGVAESGGSVQFVSTRPLSIGSRLYTPDAAQGTVGMFVPGLDSPEATPSQVLTLLSKGSRVNVGVFNPDEAAQAVTVRLFSGNGAFLGQIARVLGGQQGIQFNDIFGRFGVTGDVSAAYCLVEGDGARPIFAYAAVIDNESQDPIFVTGQDDPESPRVEP